MCAGFVLGLLLKDWKLFWKEVAICLPLGSFRWSCIEAALHGVDSAEAIAALSLLLQGVVVARGVTVVVLESSISSFRAAISCLLDAESLDYLRIRAPPSFFLRHL